MTRQRSAHRSGASIRRLRALVSGVVALAGACTLASSVPLGHARLLSLPSRLPSVVGASGHVTAVLAGFALLFLARHLRQGKRRAWRAAAALLVLSAVAHVVKGPDVPEAAAALLLAAGLWALRPAFTVPGDRPALRRLLATAPVFATCVLAYGVAALWLERLRVHPRPHGAGYLTATLRGVAGLPMGLRFDGVVFRHAFPASLALLGLGAAIVAAVVFLRPQTPRIRRAPGDDVRARAVVQAWGSDTLDYFALRDDKHWFFAADGRVLFAYGYAFGVAFVSGDPIGPPGLIPGALEEFAAACASRGWAMAFLATGPRYEDAYAALGLRSQYLGDEAVLAMDRFSLEGRAIRRVRQAVAKLDRLGYSVELLRDPEVSVDLAAELGAMDARWRRGAPERGFTMALGKSLATQDPACRVALARDADGAARAYLHLVPCGGNAPGYSLDLMRRDLDTPNGVVQYLIVRTVERLRAEGAMRLSLNFAAFARLIDGGAVHGPWQRTQRLAVRLAERRYQIASLRDFNAPFAPEWIPRRVWYGGRLDLPRVALGYLRLESFLPSRRPAPAPGPGQPDPADHAVSAASRRP